MAARTEKRERVLVICGPTATGKTGLAIALARQLAGEIVNADSRQVYRYMDIGTAKPSLAQRALVPHHLLDVVDPDASFTLADYLDLARPAVSAIAARGHLPIVAGGTGLYVRALAQGYAVPHVPPHPELRAELEQLAAREGNGALLERLRARDPIAAARIDSANTRRLIRAIEVCELTDEPLSALQQAAPAYDTLVIGLTAHRDVLHERADRRVDAMIGAGFPQEVAALLDRGYGLSLPALSSLGYRELGRYVLGEWTLDEAVRATKYATHRFIRRQLTWFRREPGIRWFDITEDAMMEQVLHAIHDWLESRRDEH